MKILFVTDMPQCWMHGIWFHRINMPCTALSLRGHGLKQVAMGTEFPPHLIEWCDTVVFGRTYPAQYDPVRAMREFKKAGKRVLYDMDDDFWQVAKDNPSINVSNALKDQYESQIRECDAVITPSKILAKKIKKHFKKDVFICPNGIDYNMYQTVPKNLSPLKPDGLTIGYMGASSHWKDLKIIGDVIDKLSEKYDFNFVIYGLTGEPLEAAMYTTHRILQEGYQPEKRELHKSMLEFYETLRRVRMLHIPFMPPELHPTVLSRAGFDIGIAPLEDNEFNRGKSCIKFYEYASTGSVCLASDVEPYASEVNYRAKNTFKDWYNKLEKLIIDPDFREKIRKEQAEWVHKNRSVEAIGLPWELACQRPGGLKVLNQE